jgi:tetratricopeptide (TPR) repeat protein
MALQSYITHIRKLLVLNISAPALTLASTLSRITSVVPLFVLFLFTGCAKLNVYRIQYNPDRQVYEYPLPGMAPATLRTNTGELVTEANFEQFITELSEMAFRYPFEKRMELANTPKELDYQLAALYSEAVSEIKEQNFAEAEKKLEQLEELYPDALLYSDLAFLKGYTNENRGLQQEAGSDYERYLSFSSQKYSERYREHRYADNNNRHWLTQKKYAMDFLMGEEPKGDVEFLQEIRPKYYFTNLQPGYTLSDEGLVEHARGIFSVSLGTDLSSSLAGGLQYYRNLYKGVDVNPEFAISRNIWEIRMALPIQVYRSDNNRLGLKVSPFGHYSNIKNIKSAGELFNVNEKVFNYGVKASMGFYFVQRLSLGAYYTYNYYNAGRPFSGNPLMPELWWDNEYDISLYYPLIKGLNLKAGMKSGDWVAGLYLTGWELSFNINEGKIILRTEMY